jgi:hypothetical protein
VVRAGRRATLKTPPHDCVPSTAVHRAAEPSSSLASPVRDVWRTQQTGESSQLCAGEGDRRAEAHHLCIALECPGLVDGEEEDDALATLRATRGCLGVRWASVSTPAASTARRGTQGAVGRWQAQPQRARTDCAEFSLASLRDCVAQMPFFSEIRMSRIEKLFITK